MNDSPIKPPRRFPSQQLSKKQQAFLRRLRDGGLVGEVQRELEVSDELLRRWLSWDYFKRRIEALTTGSHDRRRDAALDRAAADAAEHLAAAVRGDLKLDAARQRACVEVLRLARTLPAPPKAKEPEASPLAEGVDDEERRELMKTLRG